LKREPVVIALGGNAISPHDERDTIENQFAHTFATARRLAELVASGWDRMVVIHGNGPQVGNALARVEYAKDIAPVLPLDICVADTQGGMGYMIQQCIRNALDEAGIDAQVLSVVTQVEVDPADPSFGEPSKPIGPDRRLVASPKPVAVIEADVVKALCEARVIVIAGGGGGVPVVRTASGLQGVEAVVDKDHTAALLARDIGAPMLVILTDVEGIYEGFGTPDPKLIKKIVASDLRRMLGSGVLAKGSMGPKAEAACNFVESGGTAAVIAGLDDPIGAVSGTSGTRIEAG